MATLARVAGVFVRERGTRVKDQGKNGASKIPFLVLSWLRNQTEKLATQANATRNLQLLLLLRTVGYMVLALKLWPSVSITVVTWWLFFIGLPVRATLNQEIPLVHVEKRPNGRNGISRKLFMSLFPWGRFLRGGDASFQVVHELANRLGSRFGTNTKLFCGVFGPISAPNYYLNTVFDGEISLRGSCRNNALPRFPREKL